MLQAPDSPSPPTAAARGAAERWVLAVMDALGGWAFSAWLLATLASGTLAMLAMLAAPRGSDGFGAFAEDFQVWCFGLNPATGRMEPMAIAASLAQPLVLATVVWAFWQAPLRQAWRAQRRAVAAVAVVGACTIALGGVALAWSRDDDRSTQQAFPADQLRMDHPAPAFALVDQTGQTVRPADFAGKLVVLTAVYGHCGLTCPTIFRQSRRVLEALSEGERAQVVMLAVTLDPARDTPATLPRLAAAQGVSAPQWRLLSGPPEQVNAALDAMEVARRRDPATGVIDHANVFLLLDRRGRLAYRLTIGERQQRWMQAALRTLLAETKT